jgi:hypothetical protein
MGRWEYGFEKEIKMNLVDVIPPDPTDGGADEPSSLKVAITFLIWSVVMMMLGIGIGGYLI